MKINLTLAALTALLLFPVGMSAQMDERAPGIYTIIGEQSILLKQAFGGTTSGEVSVVGLDVSNQVFRYRGETSGVNASGIFVLVVNPKEKKSTDPFYKNMTPSDMIAVPLSVNHETGRREYDAGKTIEGYNVDKKIKLDFDWKRISDNSFEITVPGMTPGEYAFVFRSGKLCPFNYSRIICFTILESL